MMKASGSDNQFSQIVSLASWMVRAHPQGKVLLYGLMGVLLIQSVWLPFIWVQANHMRHENLKLAKAQLKTQEIEKNLEANEQAKQLSQWKQRKAKALSWGKVGELMQQLGLEVGAIDSHASDQGLWNITLHGPWSAWMQARASLNKNDAWVVEEALYLDHQQKGIRIHVKLALLSEMTVVP